MNSYTKDLATLALALFLMLLVAYCAQASGVPPKHRKVVAEIREVVEMVREPVPLPQRRKPSWYELFFPKDDVAADFKGVVP